MLALDAPANTVSYMIAGYAVIFGLMVIYLISLVIRHHNLNQDIKMLEELEDKENKG